MVQLTDHLLRLLDERAHRQGVSRSQVIRDAVQAYLADDEEALISRQIIEGYLRMPQDAPDEWGDPGALSGQIMAENLRALDEEERASGHESW
ncbi:MAG: ribbon-helix-helix domain-containing protein [Acidimicrobiia bacterium]